MHNLILKIREHKSFFLIINLLLLLPSIRFFVKFSNFYLFIFYVVGINILTFLIFKNIKKKNENPLQIENKTLQSNH